MKRSGIFDVATVVAIGVGWGLLGPATKALFLANPTAFDGVSVAVARAAWCFPIFLIALVVLLVRERPRMPLNGWLAIVGGSIAFGIGITFVFSVAAMHTSISHLSFLIGTSPVTNSAAAALAFRIPLGVRERTALGLGIIGVGVLAASHTGGSGGLLGDGLMLLWLASFAVYAVLLRSVGRGVSILFTMSAVGVISMGAVMLCGLAFPGAFRGIPHVFDSPSSSAWFFGEVLLGSTFIGQTAYAFAVRWFGVSVATIGAEYTALTVGIAASLAWHEPWSALTVVAGLILIAALATTFVRLPGRGTRAASA